MTTGAADHDKTNIFLIAIRSVYFFYMFFASVIYAYQTKQTVHMLYFIYRRARWPHVQMLPLNNVKKSENIMRCECDLSVILYYIVASAYLALPVIVYATYDALFRRAREMNNWKCTIAHVLSYAHNFSHICGIGK